MARPPKLNEEQWEALVTYYNEGHTYKECGVKFGVSVQTIARHFKVNNLPRRAPREPSRPDKHVIPGARRREGERTPPPNSTPTQRRIIPLKEGN